MEQLDGEQLVFRLAGGLEEAKGDARSAPRPWYMRTLWVLICVFWHRVAAMCVRARGSRRERSCCGGRGRPAAVGDSVQEERAVHDTILSTAAVICRWGLEKVAVYG